MVKIDKKENPDVEKKGENCCDVFEDGQHECEDGSEREGGGDGDGDGTGDGESESASEGEDDDDPFMVFRERHKCSLER